MTTIEARNLTLGQGDSWAGEDAGRGAAAIEKLKEILGHYSVVVTDWVLKESRRRMLPVLQREIAGQNPTPLEAALAHCVAVSLIEVEHLAALAYQRPASDAFDRRRSRAHARAMSAARTLATLRRLAIPVVQVNIAREQVNVAVATMPDPDDG